MMRIEVKLVSQDLDICIRWTSIIHAIQLCLDELKRMGQNFFWE